MQGDGGQVPFVRTPCDGEPMDLEQGKMGVATHGLAGCVCLRLNELALQIHTTLINQCLC